MLPAGVEHQPGSIEIDAIAEIEIGLGARADHRRQVKNRIGGRGKHTIQERAVADVAGHLPDARISNAAGRKSLIEQHQFVEASAGTRLRRKPAAREQRARHLLPEKSAAARDYDSHPDTASAVRLRCQRAIIVF